MNCLIFCNGDVHPKHQCKSSDIKYKVSPIPFNAETRLCGKSPATVWMTTDILREKEQSLWNRMTELLLPYSTSCSEIMELNSIELWVENSNKTFATQSSLLFISVHKLKCNSDLYWTNGVVDELENSWFMNFICNLI